MNGICARMCTIGAETMQERGGRPSAPTRNQLTTAATQNHCRSCPMTHGTKRRVRRPLCRLVLSPGFVGAGVVAAAGVPRGVVAAQGCDLPSWDEPDAPTLLDVATSRLLIATFLVILGIMFEGFQHKLVRSTSRHTRRVVASLFQELTLLGFVGLFLYLVEQSGFLQFLSGEVFGEGWEGLLVVHFHQIHMILFLVMLVYLGSVLGLMRTNLRLTREWRTMEHEAAFRERLMKRYAEESREKQERRLSDSRRLSFTSDKGKGGADSTISSATSHRTSFRQRMRMALGRELTTTTHELVLYSMIRLRFIFPAAEVAAVSGAATPHPKAGSPAPIIPDATGRIKLTEANAHKYRARGLFSAFTLKAPHRIDTPDGPVEGGVGSWLVVSAHGDCTIVPDAEFSSSYDPADGEPGKYQQISTVLARLMTSPEDFVTVGKDGAMHTHRGGGINYLVQEPNGTQRSMPTHEFAEQYKQEAYAASLAAREWALSEDFDFAAYLSLRAAHIVADMVDLEIRDWMVLELLTLILWALWVAVEHEDTFNITIMALGWGTAVGLLLLHSKLVAIRNYLACIIVDTGTTSGVALRAFGVDDLSDTEDKQEDGAWGDSRSTASEGKNGEVDLEVAHRPARKRPPRLFALGSNKMVRIDSSNGETDSDITDLPDSSDHPHFVPQDADPAGSEESKPGVAADEVEPASVRVNPRLRITAQGHSAMRHSPGVPPTPATEHAEIRKAALQHMFGSALLSGTGPAAGWWSPKATSSVITPARAAVRSAVSDDYIARLGIDRRYVPQFAPPPYTAIPARKTQSLCERRCCRARPPNQQEQLFWFGAAGPQFLFQVLRSVPLIMAMYSSVLVVNLLDPDTGSCRSADTVPTCIWQALLSFVPMMVTALVLPRVFRLYVLVTNIELMTKRHAVMEVVRHQRTQKAMRALRLLSIMRVHSRQLLERAGSRTQDSDEEETTKPADAKERPEASAALTRGAAVRIFGGGDKDSIGYLRHRIMLQEVFKLFDRDNSGVVSVANLKGIFELLGMKEHSDSVAKQMVREVAQDGTRSITFDDFFDWHAYHAGNTSEADGLNERGEHGLDPINEFILSIVDHSGKGHVTVEGLRHTLASLGQPMSEADVLHIVREVDHDGTGVLTAAQFGRLLDVYAEELGT